jgi:hypothetical protein
MLEETRKMFYHGWVSHLIQKSTYLFACFTKLLHFELFCVKYDRKSCTVRIVVLEWFSPDLDPTLLTKVQSDHFEEYLSNSHKFLVINVRSDPDLLRLFRVQPGLKVPDLDPQNCARHKVRYCHNGDDRMQLYVRIHSAYTADTLNWK